MRSDNLLKWIHDNEAMNLVVVIMNSIVDSIINVFSSSLKPFDPKSNVSAIVESSWFNKQRLTLLIL